MKRLSAMAAIALSSATLVFAQSPAAQVSVKDPWVRGTVAGQGATGAFMQLSSPSDTALVGASTPVAKIVEIHEMKVEGGVMKMSAVDKLALPAGKPVDLKPGGYHVMLMALREPLKEGQTVPITLTFEDRTGKRSSMDVKATVRPLTGGDAPGKPH
jgi:periplasmic copper chaperone A